MATSVLPSPVCTEIVDLGYGSAMATYIHAIPYMFYALVALIIVPLFIFGVIPKLGAMKSAYKRVEETGQVYSKESQKWNKNGNEEVDKEAKIVDFLFPILTMIIVQLTVGDMFIAIIAAILAAGIIYIPRKKMRTNQFCDLWVQGFADSVSALPPGPHSPWKTSLQQWTQSTSARAAWSRCHRPPHS